MELIFSLMYLVITFIVLSILLKKVRKIEEEEGMTKLECIKNFYIYPADITQVNEIIKIIKKIAKEHTDKNIAFTTSGEMIDYLINISKEFENTLLSVGAGILFDKYLFYRTEYQIEKGKELKEEMPKKKEYKYYVQSKDLTLDDIDNCKLRKLDIIRIEANEKAPEDLEKLKNYER